jgi:addiction module RelE/StbE family toxin
MKVRIMRRAEGDLRRIARYIEIDNPTAARAVVERVLERCADLADFPQQGRPAERGRRELVVTGTPYLAVYRIVGDEVQVLRVVHGRQHEERR